MTWQLVAQLLCLFWGIVIPLGVIALILTGIVEEVTVERRK
jgi:hypothetical protein